MELIERYVYAVTRRLPLDMQADVSDELHGIIQEALSDKGSRSKKAVEDVLISLGNPDIVALRYSSEPQYMIGPTLYPIFKQALKMVLSVGLPIVAAISVIVQIAEPPATPIQFAMGVAGMAISVGIQMVFWTALVFFIIERSGVNILSGQSGGGWTPSMLPEVTSDRKLPVSEAISDLIWYAFVTILPFLAQSFAGAHSNGTVTPFFDSSVWTVGGPLLVVLGIIGLVKSVLKLRIGRWTKPLALFNSLYALAFSTMLIFAATKVSLINPAFIRLIQENTSSTNLTEVTSALNWTIGISVAIAVGIYAYDAITSLFRAYRLQDSDR